MEHLTVVPGRVDRSVELRGCAASRLTKPMQEVCGVDKRMGCVAGARRRSVSPLFTRVRFPDFWVG